MSASVNEQVVALVKSVLTNATPAGLSVFRARQSALGQDELPAINIRRGSGESTLHQEHKKTRELVSFELELHDRGDDWETAVDALHMAAHQCLFNDAVLNKPENKLHCTGTELMAAEADFVAGKLVAHYQIQIITRPGDLARAIS